MKRSIPILAAATIALISCGGGGGGGHDNAPFYGGVWYGDASIVEDTCETPSEPYIFYTHLISQNGREIVIDNGAIAFVGTVEDSGAIIASTTRPYRYALSGITDCEEEITWRYENIERDVSGFVVRTSHVTCQNGGATLQCQAVHTGTASRANPSRPQPIPMFSGGVSDTAI